jgi:hypothetical protein
VNLSSRLSTLPTEIKAAAGRRWRLFPVETEGKQPLVKEWQTIATSDLAQPKACTEQWPPCNWALATGEASSLFVIDVDGRKAALHWRNWRAKVSCCPKCSL